MYMYALKIVLELTVRLPDRAKGLSELFLSKFASIVPLHDNQMCLLIWTVFSGEGCGPCASCLKIKLNCEFNLNDEVYDPGCKGLNDFRHKSEYSLLLRCPLRPVGLLVI